MEIVYTVSKKEINRRITAYTTLIFSFFVSSIIFSYNYITQYLNIFIYIILIVAALLFYSKIVVVKYLSSLLKTDIVITPEYIRKNKTKYLIKNIKKILIKQTTKGNIREVKICLNNTNYYLNNSTNNLEDLITKLQTYLPNNTVCKTIHEPIDYDHRAFYFFFGILLSFITFNIVKFCFNLNTYDIQIISYAIALLSIIMGIYFITYKPIYKRDEKESKRADYILGTIFIIGALLVLITNIFSRTWF